MVLDCIIEIFFQLIFYFCGSFEISGFFESMNTDLELWKLMIWGIGIFQESIFIQLPVKLFTL